MKHTRLFLSGLAALLSLSVAAPVFAQGIGSSLEVTAAPEEQSGMSGVLDFPPSVEEENDSFDLPQSSDTVDDDSGEQVSTSELPSPLMSQPAKQGSCPYDADVPPPPAKPVDSTELLGATTIEGGLSIEGEVDLPHFDTVQGGTGSVVGMTDNGEVWTWGDPDLVPAGDGSPTIMYQTTSIEGESIAFVNIAVQSDSVLALDQHCRLWAWGDNYKGALALPERTIYPHPTLVTRQGTNEPYYFSDISTSVNFIGMPQYSLGLSLDGNIWWWGGTKPGQSCWAASSNYPCSNSSNPRLLDFGDETFTDVVMGVDFDTKVQAGKVTVYGYAITGGTTEGMALYFDMTMAADPNGAPGGFLVEKSNVEKEYTKLPPRCRTGVSPARFVELSRDFTGIGNPHGSILGLDSCGALWTLVPGDTGASSVVEASGGAASYPVLRSIEANRNSVAALDTDGNVWTFGTNQWGQLGLGLPASTDIQTAKLTKVTKLSNIHSIAVGGEFIYAISNDQVLWGWGDNTYGQLTLPTKSTFNTPQIIAFKPSVDMYVEDHHGNTTHFDPHKVEWQIDGDGRTTGVFTALAPEHKAGYYPIYGRFGASLSDSQGANIVPVQIGQLGYLFPLDALSVESEYPVPDGGSAVISTYVSEQQAELASNAEIGLQASEGLTATKESWNGHQGKVKISAEKKGTYSLRAWASVDGKIVSFVPESGDADNTEIPKACVDANVDDVSSSCFVEAAVEFVALEHPVQIQKIGVSGGSEVIPMDGSQWRIYQDNNGSLGDVVVETAKAAVTENGEPVTGLFREELPAGVYWLEETQALNGFELLAEQVRFTVNSDGEVTLAEGGSSLISLGTTNGIPTITVQDVPKLALPEASGTSLLLFTVIGVALMAAVIATALFRMRREPGRHAA